MTDKRISRKPPEFTTGQTYDPGPYIGVVTNNTDPTRSGRLQVFIPEFGGDIEEQSHWITVSYASPYMGAARKPQIKGKKSEDNEYTNVNHSYGMWFTPPDIGNFVLITFVAGNTNRGYWFACIMPDLSHYAIPGQAGATKLETPLDLKLAEVLTSPPYPAVEWNEENKVLKESWEEFLHINKPIHEHQVKILLRQGLEDDKVRGVISSSSQRESPSRVFGISTPGIDSQEKDPDSGSPYYRFGGHTFVMDDGNADGKDKLVRLRTSGGHQILMNDTEEVIYISNCNGTAWMEFTGDGKIHMFSQSDFNLRSTGSINMHSDKDINMFAKNNVNIFSGDSIKEESDLITFKARTDLNAYGGQMEISSGSTLNMIAATQGSWGSGTELVFGSGMIYINDHAAPGVTPPGSIPVIEHTDSIQTRKSEDSPYIKWSHSGKISSTIPSTMPIPTHEPYHTIATPSNTMTKTPGSAPGTVTIANNATSSSTTSSVPNSVLSAGVVNPATPAELAAQPPSTNGIGQLSATQVTALKAQIGAAESRVSGGYAAESTRGELGKYQVTAATLIQQGYVVPGTTNAGLSDPASWTGKDGVTNKEVFKSTPDIQEKVMDKNLQTNYNTLTARGAINSSSPPEDVAGKLEVAHHLGGKGAADWSEGKRGTTGDADYNRGKYAATVLAGTKTPTVSNVSTVKGGTIT